MGVEGGVVGVFGEGGGEEGFGLVGFLLVQEEMAAVVSPEASASSPERRMSSGVSGESLRAWRSSSLAAAGLAVWSMRARARKARALRAGLSVVRVVAWRSSAWAWVSLPLRARRRPRAR